jgi:DNA-binding response OmpR family regulator
MKRILLLEDDLSLGETIKELLLENDYEVDRSKRCITK